MAKDMKDIIERRGVFIFSEEIMLQLRQTKLLQEFWRQMQFIPFRVEFDYGAGAFLCSGLSPRFAPIEKGLQSPKYNITFKIDENSKGDHKIHGLTVEMDRPNKPDTN